MTFVAKLIDRSWFFRRLGIFGTLIVCWLSRMYIVIWGADTRLMDSAYTSLCLLEASTLALYIGGAVYDHKAEGKEALQAKAIDQAPSENTDASVKVES
jgi:hypothetical protein